VLRFERKTSQNFDAIGHLENHTEKPKKSCYFSKRLAQNNLRPMGPKNQKNQEKPASTTSLDARPFHYESCAKTTLSRRAFREQFSRRRQGSTAWPPPGEWRDHLSTRQSFAEAAFRLGGKTEEEARHCGIVARAIEQRMDRLGAELVAGRVLVALPIGPAFRPVRHRYGYDGIVI
jgi:hypothetical protein